MVNSSTDGINGRDRSKNAVRWNRLLAGDCASSEHLRTMSLQTKGHFSDFGWPDYLLLSHL